MKTFKEWLVSKEYRTLDYWDEAAKLMLADPRVQGELRTGLEEIRRLISYARSTEKLARMLYEKGVLDESARMAEKALAAALHVGCLVVSIHGFLEWPRGKRPEDPTWEFIRKAWANNPGGKQIDAILEGMKLYRQATGMRSQLAREYAEKNFKQMVTARVPMGA